MFSFTYYQNNSMLPIFPTDLLSQKPFSWKRLISKGTKLLKHLDFKLHWNSKILVQRSFGSWAWGSKWAQTHDPLKRPGFNMWKANVVEWYVRTGVVSEPMKRILSSKASTDWGSTIFFRAFIDKARPHNHLRTPHTYQRVL